MLRGLLLVVMSEGQGPAALVEVRRIAECFFVVVGKSCSLCCSWWRHGIVPACVVVSARVD
jgi:hypothetical protein